MPMQLLPPRGCSNTSSGPRRTTTEWQLSQSSPDRGINAVSALRARPGPPTRSKRHVRQNGISPARHPGQGALSIRRRMPARGRDEQGPHRSAPLARASAMHHPATAYPGPLAAGRCHACLRRARILRSPRGVCTFSAREIDRAADLPALTGSDCGCSSPAHRPRGWSVPDDFDGHPLLGRYRADHGESAASPRRRSPCSDARVRANVDHTWQTPAKWLGCILEPGLRKATSVEAFRADGAVRGVQSSRPRREDGGRAAWRQIARSASRQVGIAKSLGSLNCIGIDDARDAAAQMPRSRK